MKRRKFFVLPLVGLLAFAGASCAEDDEAAVDARVDGYGAAPPLAEPESSFWPTVNVADAHGWPGTSTPSAASGLAVTAFANALSHPRWLLVLPNGDVLVAESASPERTGGTVGGVRQWFVQRALKRAGAAVPSANRITVLRDVDGDGIADVRSVLMGGLNSPLGMALVGESLYVANTDAVLKYPYKDGATQVLVAGAKVTDLPAGTINHHWTRNIIASPDGTKLYASVGANSNAGEAGMENEEGRAAVWEIDLATGQKRIFASGLRNPVGMAFVPETQALWVSVNERDELGDHLVPDYMTALKDGAFYGWPYSYFGRHLDPRVESQRPDLVASAVVPDYALGAHTASLAIAYSEANALPPHFQNGMFVSQHGSWNRTPRSGYRVIFVPFADGQPVGMPIDVLSGFVNDDAEALGRPAGIALDTRGNLLVADDIGGAVWRVSKGTEGP